MKKETNRGYQIERRMMKWFKGNPHVEYCVDFQTSKSLYEVKSCKILIHCTYYRKKKSRGKTTQLGRFWIKVQNHELLKIKAKEENKIPKYIFAICVGEQIIWKVMDWFSVDKMLNKKNDNSSIRIHEIFREELGLD